MYYKGNDWNDQKNLGDLKAVKQNFRSAKNQNFYVAKIPLINEVK